MIFKCMKQKKKKKTYAHSYYARLTFVEENTINGFNELLFTLNSSDELKIKSIDSSSSHFAIY